MSHLFECAKRVPRAEQEARVVGGGDAAADESGQVFKFGTNADQCAVDAGSDKEQCKASEETPGREQNGAPSGIEVGEETHRISQAREFNLIEVLLFRATSLLASRVASSVGRATDF